MRTRKDKIVPSVTRETQVTHEEPLKPSRVGQTDGSGWRGYRAAGLTVCGNAEGRATLKDSGQFFTEQSRNQILQTACNMQPAIPSHGTAPPTVKSSHLSQLDNLSQTCPEANLIELTQHLL